jgi:2,4-dienoyl-CoA reductase-like NADH-dependent reductase (Old Yellow Enzyme family)/thioredoxin reductase
MKAYLAESIKRHGALAILQISHGGRQANEKATGLQCVAPSAVPSEAVGRMPRELSIEQIARTVERFAAAAVRARNAGFDGVEIHGAHGYLISEFLSPFANKRTDVYGGSPENRARMPREVVEAVRAAVGQDFLVGFKVNVDEWLGDRGLPPAEARAFIRSVQGMIDYVCCSAGTYETMSVCQICSTYVPQGLLLPLAEKMRREVDIPVMAVGSIGARLGEEALAKGQADLIAMGRGHIADPEIARKLAEDRPEDIRPCCRGNEGCLSGFEFGYPLRCEINPAVGREKQYEIRPAAVRRKVLVLGGGCAGLECARVADLLGHDVTLLEKTDRLGGHLNEACVPGFKENTRDVLVWLLGQIRKSGVKVALGKQATPREVEAFKPDVLVLATGSRYIRPAFPGIRLAVFADQALLGRAEIGKKVVIIGGGQVGAETAMHIAEQGGHEVTIVEMLPELSPNMEGSAREAMLRRLHADGVKALVATRVTDLRESGESSLFQRGIASPMDAVLEVHIVDADGEEGVIVCDSAIAAIGLTPDTAEAVRYRDLGIPTALIGDACRSRNMKSCFEEAWAAAFAL